jgi:RimJ/RimL family protein N-acetyltransferase
MFGLKLKPEIETERLTLRPPEARDVEQIVHLANDVDVARMTTGIPHPYTLDHGCAFVAMAEHADPHIDLPLLIEHRKHGPVGMVGLHRREAPWPELGYWLGRDFWGMGFATEAARGLLDWAQVERGMRAAASGHFDDNPASGRVLEKLGFLYTGAIVKRRSYARRTLARTRMMVWLP